MKMAGRTRMLLTGGVLLALLVVLGVLWVRASLGPKAQHIEILPENRFARTLVIVGDKDYDPYSFLDEDGQPSGYDIEFAYALANALGYNVEIELMSWAECKRAVEEGRADMITGLDWRDEHPGVLMSMAMHNDPFVCFGREPFQIIGELYGKRLASIDESGSFVEFLRPYRLEANTTTYATYTEAMQSVIDGENDYTIARYSVGRRILAKLDEGEVRAVGPTLTNNAMCIGLSAQNAALLGPLNDTIEAFLRDGTLNALSEKWLGSYVELISPMDVLRTYRDAVFALIACLIVAVAAVLLRGYLVKMKGMRLEHGMTRTILEYQKLLTDIAHEMYDNTHEVDVTHNRVTGEQSVLLMHRMRLGEEATYDDAVQMVIRTQVKEEFRQELAQAMASERLLADFEAGETSLSRVFLLTLDGGRTYFWMRLLIRLFYWASDKSVRAIMFVQDIDAEKRKEQRLLDAAQRDGMTGLYNKVSTERMIMDALAGERRGQGALILADIDDFKHVNDRYGHAVGDLVIIAFADVLKHNTRSNDIVGRVGGDEFLIYLGAIPGRDWLAQKVAAMSRALDRDVEADGATLHFSASIGAIVTPEAGGSFEDLFRRVDGALYATKDGGKNGFTIG